MPSDLYVYLRHGRRSVLVRQVTATPTITVEDVRSEPYRDLGHRGSMSGAFGSDIVSLKTGLMFSPPSGSSGGIAVTSPSFDVDQSAPDNVTHIPPRQATLKVSYWVFTTTSGIDKKFPVADVLGWGDEPLK